MKKSPYANFSATLQPDFKVEDLKKNKTKETNIMPADVQPGDYTNGITGFEDGDNIFKNLTKLASSILPTVRLDHYLLL